MDSTALITNDAVVLGLLIATLALVFYTSSLESAGWKKFYTYVPSLLLCYFIPSLYNSFGLISGEASGLYYMASRYLLPASLVLLTLGIDFKGIISLGPKALIMFLAGTLGIVLGGPLAVLTAAAISPDLVGGVEADAVWRGLATVAGSWIGGGANQAAMLEVFGASPELFSRMIAVDVLVANVWLAVLLYWAGRSARVDRWFKADATAIEHLKEKVENYRAKIAEIPTTTHFMVLAGLAFFGTGLGHLIGDAMSDWLKSYVADYPWLQDFSLTSPFLWLVLVATTFGLVASFTSLRKYEGVGASKVGSAFLYVLVATIGMNMDITAVFDYPGLFLVGGMWMLFHVTILLIVAYLIKAPFFFVAVGSQANVGGAASAPIVASAFSPSLAPVGVLLAVLGYALGTYAAYICGLLLQFAAGG
ncbi:MAG: DUF819 family protein [Cyclobacteriaceae bacterium]|nr:DUF819 family protein [Cyclobacteriaceae bacterium]MCH8515811.1 DUF819 family protein [Cyclobacteriaceae bacterium]